MEAIVWSKDPCPFCDRAKNLLKLKGIEFEERNITTGNWTKEQLMESVPGARTVPQILINGQLIGGFNELQQHLQNVEGGFGDGRL
jgi:glutaredoxin 3